MLGLPPVPRERDDDLLHRRDASFAAVQEHYYPGPPRIERGWQHHLAGRHELIGAVHGSGLHLGVEFVRDRGTLEPATEETVAICNRMLGLGVIIQPTSDRMCVLKIKPPLCLDTDGADFFADSLDRVLAEGW